MITVLSTRASKPSRCTRTNSINCFKLRSCCSVGNEYGNNTWWSSTLHGSRLWWSGIVNGFSFVLYISTKWATASQPIRLITVLVTYVLCTQDYFTHSHTGEINSLDWANKLTHSFPSRFLRVPSGRKDWLCLLITASNSHIWRWDIPCVPGQTVIRAEILHNLAELCRQNEICSDSKHTYAIHHHIKHYPTPDKIVRRP